MYIAQRSCLAYLQGLTNSCLAVPVQLVYQIVFVPLVSLVSELNAWLCLCSLQVAIAYQTDFISIVSVSRIRSVKLRIGKHLMFNQQLWTTTESAWYLCTTAHKQRSHSSFTFYSWIDMKTYVIVCIIYLLFTSPSWSPLWRCLQYHATTFEVLYAARLEACHDVWQTLSDHSGLQCRATL